MPGRTNLYVSNYIYDLQKELVACRTVLDDIVYAGKSRIVSFLPAKEKNKYIQTIRIAPAHPLQGFTISLIKKLFGESKHPAGRKMICREREANASFMQYPEFVIFFIE